MEKIKKFIRNNELAFKVVKPCFCFLLKVLFWTKVFFDDRGIMRYYFIYPLESLYRVVRAKIQPEYLEGIKGLRNKYKGERCFIVASGPSLKLEDINTLYKEGEYSFGLNSIYCLYAKTDWRPDFYCCIDLELEREIEEQQGVVAFEKLGKRKTFLDSRVKTVPKTEKVEFIHYNRLLHGFGVWDNDFKYSDDLIYGLYDMYDVTITTIQIAKYMGFSEVYLLGVDCDYGGEKRYIDGAEMDSALKLQNDYYEYMQKQKKAGFQFLKNSIEKDGDFKIHNATRGGKLEIFPRVDFDKLFLEE